MEAPESFPSGHCRAGISQFGAEKQGKAGGDHFIVEDLLDFSNEEEEEEETGLPAGDDVAFESAAGNSTDSSTVTAVESCNSSFSGGDPHLSGELVCRSLTDANLSGDLCEPYDELAELEWLSNFVEESFSSEDLQKLQLISGVRSSSSETRGGDISVASGAGGRAAQSTHFLPEGPVPAKARSKRSRAAPCSWSSRLLVLSSTISTSVSDADPPAATPVVQSNFGKKTPKPAKKKDLSGGGSVFTASDCRKCLHCATDKTPQWRTGPMGPKTLCNACGVRYKSGRLVPEYRPAASPTFMLSKHSNSHRKVLELRRQKEMQQLHPHQPFLHPGSTAAAVYGGDVEAVGDEFLIHNHLGPEYRQLI